MMKASIKQLSISIPTLVKCFSWFLSESDDLSFERVCSVRWKKTSLKIVVAFHPKHEWIPVSNFIAMF
jgi:hypothetical protein